MLVVTPSFAILFVPMYTRIKRVKRGEQAYEYVQLVEGRREGGKVRQRVVATLGRLDELKASGQLDRFAGSFARLDPPPVGTHREVGPLLLVAHYLRRLGLVSLVDEIAPVRGRSLLTHGEVIAALVANRLCGPAPLYDIASWASAAAVAELFDVPAGLLNDDRLGRALDAIAPHAEDLRGRLLLRTIERFKVDASRLHLDLTAVRFSGSYEHSALVKKGWAADRTIKRQMKTLQASTKSGVSLYFRPHQGASSELPAFMAAIETLAASLPPGLVVVADSGLGYLENLCAIDSAKVSFVVPLRADTGWARRFPDEVPAGLGALKRLAYCSQREQRLAPKQRTVWKGLLRPFPVTAKNGVTHDLPRRIHLLLRGGGVGQRRPRASRANSRGGPRADRQRARWSLLQDQTARRRQSRHHPLGEGRLPDHGRNRRARRQADHHLVP